MFKILFLFVSLCAIYQAHASIFDSMVEKGVYKLLKQGLISNGMTEVKADCIVNFLKWQGATDDVTDLRNILQPKQMVDKLMQKADIAKFVCTMGGPVVVFIIFILLFACCIQCCVCCCRSSEKVVHVVTLPQRDQQNITIPYERMDKV